MYASVFRKKLLESFATVRVHRTGRKRERERVRQNERRKVLMCVCLCVCVCVCCVRVRGCMSVCCVLYASVRNWRERENEREREIQKIEVRRVGEGEKSRRRQRQRIIHSKITKLPVQVKELQPSVPLRDNSLPQQRSCQSLELF